MLMFNVLILSEIWILETFSGLAVLQSTAIAEQEQFAGHLKKTEV